MKKLQTTDEKHYIHLEVLNAMTSQQPLFFVSSLLQTNPSSSAMISLPLIEKVKN